MRIYPVKRPLCAAIIAFIIGLWLRSVWAPDKSGCAFFVLVLTGCGLFYFASKRSRLFIICALTLTAGFFLMHQETTHNQSLVPLHGEEATITVHLTRAPADRTYVDGEVTAIGDTPMKEAVPLRIQRAWCDETTYQTRASYTFSGTFRAPEPPRNPGGYDEAKILAQRGIFTFFDAESPGQQCAPPPDWAVHLENLKATYNEILARHLDPGEQALIVSTLFGDVSTLSEDFYNLSQQFGIIHIFSVSGLHVSFILAFVLVIARLLRCQHSWWLVIIMTPLLTLYTLLSDASAPAVRASIMGIATLLALRLLRYRDPLTILALAALMLLLADPYNLWQIGFQLSFLAMLGLIVLTPRFEPYLSRLPAALAGAIATSLAAECISLPLVAYYFYQIAPLSTVMNLLVVPFFSALVPLALVALLLTGFVPALGTLAFLPVKALILAIVAIMDIINQVIGTLHVYIGQPPFWLLLLFYTFLLVFCLIPQEVIRWQRLALIGTLLCLAVLILRPATSRDLRLTAVDVGQGTGCTYQTAAGDWLVFDTGPSADTMAQYLRYSGVNTIEALVISHGDLDHIGGAAHILRDFNVRTLLASAAAQTTEEWQALLPYLDNTEIITVTQPHRFRLGNATLDCMLVAERETNDENANQLVARLDDAGLSTLFTGDTAAEALDEISWQPTDLVLVPHHGSKNSWRADFYEALSPQLALISAGAHNRYGHPHAETTDGLAALAIPTACTAQDGAVQLYVDDDALWLKRQLNP